MSDDDPARAVPVTAYVSVTLGVSSTRTPVKVDAAEAFVRVDDNFEEAFF